MITEQEMNKGMATLKIIWSAILMSLAIYAVVGRLIAPNLPPPLAGEGFAALRLALYAIAFATVIGVRYVRKLILAGRSRSAEAMQERPGTIVQRYTGAVIVSLAMCESVGIYGLVLYILGRGAADLYLLLGIAVAATFYYRPKKEELTNLSRERT